MHGMISQVEGLAKALDLDFIHEKIEINNFWKLFPPKVTPVQDFVFKNKIDRFSSTSLQPNVSNAQIESLKIALPPIELQNEFADKIALIKQQKALAKQELQESEDLFNCLLQQAFKGELD